jgi:CCAAT-binding transcription factor (CBF-B/NF-YA) subunit B
VGIGFIQIRPALDAAAASLATSRTLATDGVHAYCYHCLDTSSLLTSIDPIRRLFLLNQSTMLQPNGQQQEVHPNEAVPPRVTEVVQAQEETAASTVVAPAGGADAGMQAMMMMMMMSMTPPSSTAGMPPVATNAAPPPQFYPVASNIPQNVTVQVPCNFPPAVVVVAPPPPPEKTVFVNRHQYHRIEMRRESRRVLEAYYERCRQGKKRPHPNYEHESRHRHAQNRPRNRKGHFMTGPELAEYYRNNPDKAPPNYKHPDNKSSLTRRGKSASSDSVAAADADIEVAATATAVAGKAPGK